MHVAAHGPMSAPLSLQHIAGRKSAALVPLVNQPTPSPCVQHSDAPPSHHIGKHVIVPALLPRDAVPGMAFPNRVHASLHVASPLSGCDA